LVPDGLTSVASNILQYSELLSLDLSESQIVTISTLAFFQTKLQTILLPPTLITVGNNIFDGSQGLIAVTIYPALTTIGSGLFENTTALLASSGAVSLEFGSPIDTYIATNYPTINRISLYPPPPCFLEGTKILCSDESTPKGTKWVEINTLKPGTRVFTESHGFVPVKSVISSTIRHSDEGERNPAQLFRCTADAYGDEVVEDLVLTGCHSILVSELSEQERADILKYMGRIFITEGYYRLPAFADHRAQLYNKNGAHSIWHVCLEHEWVEGNYGILANGLLVESCSEFDMSRSKA